MSKKLKVLFTLSILANILLAGSLCGMIFDKKNDMPWQQLKEGLSPEGQNLVTKMFQDLWKSNSSVMRQSMDNRKYLAAVISADKFDPEKYDEAVKRMRGVQDLITKNKVKSTKELLMSLSDEDRKKLAEHVANSFARKSGHSNKSPHDQPPKPGEDDDRGHDKDDD
ncbi:MAG: periplasmic heavy metal sensor [Alphaproteobacteria bacterium]